ncbi:MAG TPA: hypothetical protein DHW82_12300 [Spirochaetia bacterium]|nr:hypothetical protein [Spirochaetia bacterium]
MKKKLSFYLKRGAFFFLSLAVISGCGGYENKTEQELIELSREALKNDIFIQENIPSQIVPKNIENISNLPKLDTITLYGETPDNDPNSIYIEVATSTEKGVNEYQDLMLYAVKKFNDKRETINGKTVKIGLRSIASGTAYEMISAGVYKPNGYTPANPLWIELLRYKGVDTAYLGSVVNNPPGLVMKRERYEKLEEEYKKVDFNLIMELTMQGKIFPGYPSPYSSSTALNFLYSILYEAAKKQNQILSAELITNEIIASAFTEFQKSVKVIGPTTTYLREIFEKYGDNSINCFPVEKQDLYVLKKNGKLDENALVFIPFGKIEHNNPLVSLPWNTKEENEALASFYQYLRSAEIQRHAQNIGFEAPNNQFSGLPDGKLLMTAQSLWKNYKDAGRKVYSVFVVDRSGSMNGEPLLEVKKAMFFSAQYIKRSSEIGLISFSDDITIHLPINEYNNLQQGKYLTAIDDITAGGQTFLFESVLQASLMLEEKKKQDPKGKFYIFLLTDGLALNNNRLSLVVQMVKKSGITVIPVAYNLSDVNELNALAEANESSIISGKPEDIISKLQMLFETMQ